MSGDTGRPSVYLQPAPPRRLSNTNDGRCTRLDDDGCRCLRRSDHHAGPCDFPYTRWRDTRAGWAPQ